MSLNNCSSEIEQHVEVISENASNLTTIDDFQWREAITLHA